MTDNLAPQSEMPANTTFMEERAIISEQAKHDVSMQLPPEIEQHMPDEHWFAKQQLTKPVQIGQYEWNPTQARGTIITSFKFPNILDSVESLMTRTLRMYAFYKLSPVVRLQINSTQFHQGQLIMTFDPFSQSYDTYADAQGTSHPVHDLYYATGLPSVKVMASESDPIELRIPFVHPRSFLVSNSDAGYDTMGKVRIQVLNPLQAAEGATTNLTITVWIYASDASVHVPIAYHQATPSGLTELISQVMGPVSQGVQNTRNAIGHLASGNVGGALRSGQGLIDNLGSVFGFDYPTRIISPEKTISPVENLAVGMGASRSHRLAIDPESGYIPSPSIFGSSTEDMDFMKIARTPMLLAQLKWNTTDNPGASLMEAPVAPSVAPQIQVNGVNVQLMSYLAYVAQFFNYWRGGIIYDIEFVATRYHSGRLLVSYQPNYSVPTYSAASSSNPNVILDIQQTSKISFMVPFTSPTAMKTTRNNASDEFETGFVRIFVQNRLCAASNVPSDIEINVYVRAAEDFQFYVPRAPTFNFQVPPTPTRNAIPSISGIELQSNRTKDEGSSTVAQLCLGSGISPPEQRFGESYSMLDLIRRFTFLYKSQLPVSVAENPFQVDPGNSRFHVHPRLTPGSPFAKTMTISDNSYLSQIGRIFSIWSGSIRYKFVNPRSRNTESALAITHYPDWDFIPNGTASIHTAGYGLTLTTLAQDNTLEVEVPYYSPFNFLLTTLLPDDLDADGFRYDSMPLENGVLLQTVFGTVPDEAEGNVTQYVFIAAGDDFRYGYLRPPSITQANNAIYSLDKVLP
jgi:hypothetical protein